MGFAAISPVIAWINPRDRVSDPFPIAWANPLHGPIHRMGQ
jgi:hypothetical protein